MRGTACTVFIFVCLVALAACAGRAKPPAIKLVVHSAPAAPSAAASTGQHSAALAQPQEWWTTGGGYLRRCSSAAQGPGSGAPELRVPLPARIGDGPCIDSSGQAWVLAEGVLYSVPAGASAACARSDPQQWYYTSFTLGPGDGLLAVRLPFHPQFKGETVSATFSPFAAETQLVLLDADGTDKWAWDAKGALVCPLITPAGDVYCLSDVDSYKPSTDTTTLYALGADGKPRWELAIHDIFGQCRAIVLGTDDVLYFSSASGRLYAVGQDGQLKWMQQGRAGLLGGNKLADFGTTGLALQALAGEIIYSTANDGPVCCVDASGQQLWQFQPRRDFTLSMALTSQGELYAADHLGWLYLFSAAGHQVWSTQITGFGAALLAVDGDGKAYCATPDGQLSVVDRKGQVLYSWQFAGYPTSIALDSHGRLYLAAMEPQATTSTGTLHVWQ
jgi:outer membrane protein assembly factor BamB